MALTKPLLYTVSAFDATQAQTFQFNVIGGDQVVGSKLIVTNQATGAVVSGITMQSGYSYTYTLPANKLANHVSGTSGYYSATIVTYNAAGTESVQSNAIQFYCYTTPTFSFTNIPSGGVISSSSYNFQATYNQVEGEALSSYTMTLYNSSQVQLATSGIQYTGSSTVPFICSYIFDGLENNTTYYVSATAQTIHGTQLSIGLTQIVTRYTPPSAFTIVELTNNCTGGYVLVKSNMVAIDGISNPSPPTYVSDTQVDLTSSGSWVEWNAGYDISTDFTASIWGKSFNANSTIISMKDDIDNTLTIKYQNHPNGGVYALCRVEDNGYGYYIYTPTITTPQSTDTLQVWIRRVGTLYDIKLANITSPAPSGGTSVLGQAILGTMVLGQ